MAGLFKELPKSCLIFFVALTSENSQSYEFLHRRGCKCLVGKWLKDSKIALITRRRWFGNMLAYLFENGILMFSEFHGLLLIFKRYLCNSYSAALEEPSHVISFYGMAVINNCRCKVYAILIRTAK